MKTRLKQLKLRDLALFVVVTSVVAVTTVCGAHEIGLDGERAGAHRFEPGSASSAPTESGASRGAAQPDPEWNADVRNGWWSWRILLAV